MNSLILAGALTLGTMPAVYAQPGVPNPPPSVPVPPAGPPHVPGLAPERSASIVITKDAASAQDIADAEEDLNVMARILEKAIRGDGDRGSRNALGLRIERGLLGADTTPKNLYLEGYGVVFMLDVPFPLSSDESSNPGAKAEAKPPTEWDEARQELYAAGGGGWQIDVGRLIAPHLGTPEPYDEGKVEELKNSLIAALKNAVNIRKLKGDETVTVIVKSNQSAAGRRFVSQSSGTTVASYSLARSPESGRQTSRLVLSAKRADIEAFSKNRDMDQFRKKVSLVIQ